MIEKSILKKICSFIFIVIYVLTIVPNNAYAEGRAAKDAEDTVVAKLKDRGFKEVEQLGAAASSVSLKTAIIAKENGRDVVYTTQMVAYLM